MHELKRLLSTGSVVKEYLLIVCKLPTDKNLIFLIFYNNLINQTKEHVIGYMPITTPLFACDSEIILNVTKEWYERP